MDDRRERLYQIAGAIADGSVVDWQAAETEALSAEERAVLARLKIVADVARLHDGEADPVPTEPETWGRLRILERVGSGAAGETYRAWDDQLKREVALKLLRTSSSLRSDPASSVVEEAQLLARVRHPYVVTIYGADRHGDRVGLSMEFIRGRTLEQIVDDERGPLTAGEAASIGRKLCQALREVHRAGLVHGDVKARNVMREASDPNDRIVLMDFSASRKTTTDRSAGAVTSGTPLYMAPEVLTGRPASVRSDLYSLGVLLYFLVTGSYPVDAKTVEEIRAAHAERKRRLLKDARPELPVNFVRAVERAIAVDPEARFQNASAPEAELSRGAVESPLGRILRYRGRIVLPAVLAIGAAVALATRWSFRAQPEPPEARESTALVDTKVSPDATTGDSTNPVARLSTGGGKDGPQISLVQKSIELAALYQAIGDYASAKAVYERALKIQERELDPDDLQLAHTLSRLGWVLETLRSYSEAKALLTRALAIYEKKLGPEHPLTSNTLASLGSIHRHLGAHAEAALLLKRAEALRKPNHTLAPRPAMESLNLLSASEALQDGAPEFTIEAKLYRHGSREEPLSEGLRVAPGDRLSLKLRASQDLFVYVINEDQRGESFLLSPLPGQELPQPLPANTVHHLPGRMAGREVLWQVTSAGGREFFFVVASRRRLREFERELQSVPRAQPGALRLAVPLSDGLRRALRGIGGLVAKERAAGAPPPSGELFRMAASLGAEAETVRGIWIRRLTLDNP